MVDRADCIPGGGVSVADAEGDAPGADVRSPHAAISAAAAAVPTPSSASRRRGLAAGQQPSTWSVAISSAM